MSDYVTIWSYDDRKKRREKPVRVKTEFAAEHLCMSVPDRSDLVFGTAAYKTMMKKVEMAEKLCPGTALWREDV